MAGIAQKRGFSAVTESPCTTSGAIDAETQPANAKAQRVDGEAPPQIAHAAPVGVTHAASARVTEEIDGGMTGAAEELAYATRIIEDLCAPVTSTAEEVVAALRAAWEVLGDTLCDGTPVARHAAAAALYTVSPARLLLAVLQERSSDGHVLRRVAIMTAGHIARMRAVLPRMWRPSTARMARAIAQYAVFPDIIATMRGTALSGPRERLSDARALQLKIKPPETPFQHSARAPNATFVNDLFGVMMCALYEDAEGDATGFDMPDWDNPARVANAIYDRWHAAWDNTSLFVDEATGEHVCRPSLDSRMYVVDMPSVVILIMQREMFRQPVAHDDGARMCACFSKLMCDLSDRFVSAIHPTGGHGRDRGFVAICAEVVEPLMSAIASDVTRAICDTYIEYVQLIDRGSDEDDEEDDDDDDDEDDEDDEDVAGGENDDEGENDEDSAAAEDEGDAEDVEDDASESSGAPSTGNDPFADVSRAMLAAYDRIDDATAAVPSGKIDHEVSSGDDDTGAPSDSSHKED